MRRIQKSLGEPKALVEFRAGLGAEAGRDSWNDFPYKDAIRSALCEDQGNLCCYCMARIPQAKGMKVEHYLPRSRQPAQALTWCNLLGACMGSEGSVREQQTCDTRKGDRELFVDPRRIDHIASLRYLSDGRIKSCDEAIQRDIEDTLNLNVEALKCARAQALETFVAEMTRNHGRGAWPKGQLAKEIARIRETRPLREYAGMIEWWLDRRAKRVTSS